MTYIQQRAALQRQIWQIADDVRGAVDGWDFKQYVLGALFYRFISETFISHMKAGDESIDYAATPDEALTPDIIEDSVKTKGFFIYPSQLFCNVVKNCDTNENLNTDLANIFRAIEASATGYASELAIKGLFADFDTTSNRLGQSVREKNSRLAHVLKGIAKLRFNPPATPDNNKAEGEKMPDRIDLFGDAYEFLISNYAANAGKSGGEFFTPQYVSKLIAKIALRGQSSVNRVYDPACGSGSLLLQAIKHGNQGQDENKKEQEDQLEKDKAKYIIEDGFFGQEINHTNYNLARMNMFLHGIDYEKFNIRLGNTLLDPYFLDNRPFDAIISNPPYSIKWIGKKDPALINDERFAPAGALAPDSKADFAFVLHALHYLSPKGRAAIVCFPGIFYRGGAEKKIRKYLVDNNFVETVIALPPNLFFGTSIAVNILVLSKHKTDTDTQFINASSFFKKEVNNNVLLDEHIDEILRLFDNKDNVQYLARQARYDEIVDNDYNLSVNTYVEAKNTREPVDIDKINAELAILVPNINRLREETDKLANEILGCKYE